MKRAGSRPWSELERAIVQCERCPRLRAYGRAVARERRRAYREETYWGRPVPGFGDRAARILVLGLAPAAHGANRTGRMFTGDRSGEWLYAALHRVGLATCAESTRANDGLALDAAFVTAACRCAPPQNRPTPRELAACAAYLDREIELLRGTLRVVLALGAIAWNTAWNRARRAAPSTLPRPRPRFSHGAEARIDLGLDGETRWLVGCYHPSQQNTLTGRLTRPMLDSAVERARELAGLSGASSGFAAQRAR